MGWNRENGSRYLVRVTDEGGYERGLRSKTE